jgi:hypothetical protein
LLFALKIAQSRDLSLKTGKNRELTVFAAVQKPVTTIQEQCMAAYHWCESGCAEALM